MARPKKNITNIDSEKKVICIFCGKTKVESQSNFYSSKNDLIDKSLNLCKDCVKKISNSNINNLNMINFILMLLDRPFIYELWESKNNLISDNRFGVYLKDVSSLPQYKSFKYKDGDKIYFKNQIESNLKGSTGIDFDEIENDFETTPYMVAFWGKGFTKEDYYFLENEYDSWTTRHKCEEYAEEILYKEICLSQLDIRKTRALGENVDKKVEALQKLMTSANVKPSDANAANSDERLNTYGLWIKEIENTEPCEYFKDRPLYVDFDKLKTYLYNFVLRPLKNLLAGNRDFDIKESITEIDEVDELDKTSEIEEV